MFFSRLIGFVAVAFVLIPPLAHLLFLLLPPPPPARVRADLQRKTKKIQISHFVCLWGIFAKMSLQKSWFLFSVVDLLCPQNMFVWFSWNVFEAIRDFFVVAILFWCLDKSFLSVQLSSCACILWIGSLFCSCSFYFCVSACLVGYMGSVCFGVFFFVILGLSFLHCSLFMVFFLLHVLAPRFCMRGHGLPFYGNRFGGSFGDGHAGGVNIFLIIGVFGWKQALPSRARVQMIQTTASSVSKRRPLSILSQETLQEQGFQRQTCANDNWSIVISFFVFSLWRGIYWCSFWGGFPL